VKIMLVQMLEYLFVPGGAHKANRKIMEDLAASGHECHVIASGPDPGEDCRQKLDRQLRLLGFECDLSGPSIPEITLAGVHVHLATSATGIYSLIKRLVGVLDPDVAVVTEDQTQLMLRMVMDSGARKSVYLAHSQATLPFGPAAFDPSPEKKAVFERADGVIAVSRYVADYIRSHSNQRAEVIYSPVYGTGPFPCFGRPDQGFVTMINPSRIKGIDLFLALARANPGIPFAAVPTWATTGEDRAALEAAGVRSIPASDHFDEVLAQIRVLVVPSLWGEAFGQVVVEAMLRGIPVMASDLGGLPEAKSGVDYLCPVTEISEYEDRVDERNVQIPIVPEQDIAPWQEALERLVTDPDHYRELSRRSREAAARFVSKSDIDRYISYLDQLKPKSSEPDRAEPKSVRMNAFEGLSPAQREFIRRRLTAGK